MKKLIIICVLLICCVGYSQSPTNIVIGDSQTSYVDINSKKVNRVVGLWKKGNNVPNLTKMIQRYKVSPNVQNIFLCIGTNDLYVNNGIEKLFNSICITFPNAKIYVIQGSWGWGGLKRTGYDKVKRYYKRYEELGGTIIEPPIGKGEPHRSELKSKSPMLLFEDDGVFITLTGYFGDNWKQPFIDWFWDKFHVPIKTVNK